MQQQRESVPRVVVSDGYAVAAWSGAGGGSDLFRKSRGRWVKVGGGGGVIDACYVESFGASPQIAHKLMSMLYGGDAAWRDRLSRIDNCGKP